ncbi:MAG: DNA repair protein RadC [Clostridia bacterium]
MPIKKLPTSERPYEKAQMYGIESLSNSELLAIIIKTGTKEKTSVELAQEILAIESKNKDNIQFLQDISIEEFMHIKGIGKVKAIQIKAVCELTKRMSRPIENIETRIRTSDNVAQLLMNEMKFEKREKLKVLVLNTKNVLLKIIDVSYGGTNSATVEPKDVLTEPIKMGAPRIILVHNHPSGDPTPSEEDIELTKRIYNAASILGIYLLDHVIIGNNKYASIFSTGRIGV